MNYLKHKIALAVIMLSPLSVFAGEKCDLNYKLNLRLGYSKGSFDIQNQENETRYSETHNTASRIGGSVGFTCGKTEFKYTHHSVFALPYTKINTGTIINTFAVSNEDYGSLTIGKLSTPYKVAGKKGDPFWDTAAGTTFAANNFGFSAMTRGFTKHSVMYKSPTIGKINITMGYSGKNSNGDIHSGVEFNDNGYTFGIQYLDIGESAYVANGQNSRNAVRLYNRYKLEDWLFSASFEDVSPLKKEREHYFNLSVQKNIHDFGRAALSYGYVSDAMLKLFDASIDKRTGHGLSGIVFYDLFKNAELYLMSSYLDFNADVKQKTLALGFNYNFNL